MSLYEKTAFELSGMLAQKTISSVELTEDVFNRIDQVEDKTDAYLTLNREDALKQAAAVDAKRAAGEMLPPLAGIPVGIKDNICTKDIRTTCASKMLENFVPPYNATVMSRLAANDIVMTGKLNMDEFAMGSSTENSHFKTTKNPHGLDRVPGGSSGGSASAVAAGECIVSLGSDTGGSIRQPASLCGVFGLKPTYGSVSRFGLVAFASSLDQIGPFGRSTKDVAMLYSAICGQDNYDATSVYRDYPDFLGGIDLNQAKGMTVGLPKEYFDGADVQVRARLDEAIALFKKAGVKFKEISLPSTGYALSAYYIIASAEASSNLARFDGVKYGYRTPEYDGLIDMYEKTRSEGFGDEVKRRIMLGTFVLSSGYYDAYYKKAKMMQKQIAAEFEQAFQSCDVLMTPTTPTTAFKIGENIGDPLKMYLSDVCTVTVNIAGLPAISVPCGKDDKGLPVGMQLIGPKFSEQTLFNLSELYETESGFSYEMPLR
ncbi:MAG: Asp-tRNA(Asn)/Glu-tRNA(Gln) amidotransferase subunit GatA [Oscillospiraceae bacterium]|jgi:aspartyl-tRNA(Asn)/glutamyl-tRNA(Gln) amidotransferase subunit A